MIQRVQANINLHALVENFQLAKKLSAQSKMAVVIKANAYGHGLLPVAQALAASADLFAVTDITEAQKLHSVSINKPILILQGIITTDDIKLICANNFQLVVHSLEQLALLDEEVSKIKLTSPLTFWLKLESGMGRLGISPQHYGATYHSLKNKAYTKEVILMTHLANSSLPDSELTSQQLSTFRQLEQQIKTEFADHNTQISTSIAASSGILSNNGSQSNWARPGLMLYGSSPFQYAQEHLRKEHLGLKTVMSLQARIIAIQHLKAGANVGYCSQFICSHDMNIAIVSIGYADGYPSTAPNGTPVLVNGKRCTTVGRVSMDMIAVDISNCPEANVGDLATLWGGRLSVDEIAEKTGILSYNLTCSIASRVSVVHG